MKYRQSGTTRTSVRADRSGERISWYRFSKFSQIKTAVVKRLNRTLHERIWRYFLHRNTKRYIDVLQKIVYAHNQTLHSGTRIRPAEVNFYNAARARENLGKRACSNYRSRHRAMPHRKFNVGDHVRVSRTKNTFEQGYEQNFSEEIFKIKRVSQRQALYTYEAFHVNCPSARRASPKSCYF